MDSLDVKTLDIPALETLVREYPWFAYARQVLLSKLAEKGKEHMDVQMQKSSAFIPCRKVVYLMTLDGKEVEDLSVIDFDEFNREFLEITSRNETVEESKEERKSDQAPKYIVLGADYFSKDDFEQLEDVNPFKIGKLGDAQDDADDKMAENQNVEQDVESADIDDFYTETLARIYAEQGYYEEAIKIYAKLILLYPEKSAYFATLVNEVKSKNN
ncbi:MAG: tetratricopeptide repeat protein [Bacteroidales bacterium]|nr:tetratricopeptide repeat protein [Bacteroidales bacterium]